MEQTTYQVKTAVFEGPFDLLLDLIQKRKLFINEISLAEVTKDYLEFLKKLKEEREISMSEIANFIVVAATLILIKSRSLLPGIELSEEEEESIEELEARLKTYEVIREIGKEIEKQFGKQIIFARTEPELLGLEGIFAPGKTLSANNLQLSIIDVIGRLPKKEKRPVATVKKVISLEEMIEKLTERIGSAASFSFEEFKKRSPHKEPKEKKVYAIVSFLALLELVKQGLVNVIQDKSFGDIQVSNSCQRQASAPARRPARPDSNRGAGGSLGEEGN